MTENKKDEVFVTREEFKKKYFSNFILFVVFGISILLIFISLHMLNKMGAKSLEKDLILQEMISTRNNVLEESVKYWGDFVIEQQKLIFTQDLILIEQNKRLDEQEHKLNELIEIIIKNQLSLNNNHKYDEKIKQEGSNSLI